MIIKTTWHLQRLIEHRRGRRFVPRPSAQRDPRTIAVRLIALLPRKSNANISPHGAVFGAGANSWRVIVIVVYVILVAFMLGDQFVISNRQQRPVRIDNAHAPASATVPPQVPLTTSSP